MLLPQTVGGEYEEEVRPLRRVHADLRRGDEPAAVGSEVAQAARDAQPRPEPRLALLLVQPRGVEVVRVAALGPHPAARRLDPRLLGGQVDLVILREGQRAELPVVPRAQHGAAIARARHHQLLPTHPHHDGARAAVRRVDGARLLVRAQVQVRVDVLKGLREQRSRVLLQPLVVLLELVQQRVQHLGRWGGGEGGGRGCGLGGGRGRRWGCGCGWGCG